MNEFTPLKAPFPWFGGKSRAASIIWQAFGSPLNYVEPFAGSLAVLLGRSNYDPLLHTETVNDLDCYLANFWRSISRDPEGVAHWANYPVSEVDLIARHRWLIARSDFQEKMKSDPDCFDVKIAGWWVWGLCSWIGSGWCKSDAEQRPQLGNSGQGINRKIPHLGNSGRGNSELDRIVEYFASLADRLRRVRVCCGEWNRVLTPSVTTKHGLTAVLLDPPYSHELRDRVYSNDTDCSTAVREWAIANGGDPLLRIALCGYSDEHVMPDGWRSINWKAPKGYNTNENRNRFKETIWFSPHCISIEAKPVQRSLFDLVG